MSAFEWSEKFHNTGQASTLGPASILWISCSRFSVRWDWTTEHTGLKQRERNRTSGDVLHYPSLRSTLTRAHRNFAPHDQLRAWNRLFSSWQFVGPLLVFCSDFIRFKWHHHGLWFYSHRSLVSVTHRQFVHQRFLNSLLLLMSIHSYVLAFPFPLVFLVLPQG